MLSTKIYNNNSSLYANSATFDNISINGVITNNSLTTNINTISENINTIRGSLNNLTNYISTTISSYINLNCNNINYNELTMIKPQTQYTTNIAFQQFINQIYKINLMFL